MIKNTIDDLEKTYDLCVSLGNIREKIVDVELIKSVKMVAEKRVAFINHTSRDISKNSSDWTFVFTDYYESLRGLIEAYLLFDGIQSDNHQCSNAYLCIKHADLELDWKFLETVRLKRNAINYRGQLLHYDDWKMLKLKMDLHITALKKEIEKKLLEYT